MSEHPPFRLLQRDTTHESWLWYPEENRWHKCNKTEFYALRSFAEILQMADDPVQLLKDVSTFLDE